MKVFKKNYLLRAAQFNNLEEAARIFSDAMEIDPRNKGTNAKILASRAEVYAKVRNILYIATSVPDPDDLLRILQNVNPTRPSTPG